MPIYEYLCEGCGRISELMQKISDPAPKKCPECGSKKIAKLVSRTAFQLKGGGWYADLYSSARKESKPANDGGSGGEKTPSPKADAATAPKPNAGASPASSKPAAEKSGS